MFIVDPIFNNLVEIPDKNLRDKDYYFRSESSELGTKSVKSDGILL